MKNSMTAIKDDNMQRIKVSKRSIPSPTGLTIEEGNKKSMDIAEAFEHQKMMAQMYRQKNQRNIMKCKFLYNKLTALGSLEGVPEMIAAQVSEIDVKIKEMQQLLNFKRSQQMKKLRKKVSNFLQQINFEIQPEDMEKIEDQIEIILFLIDIFEEKFNQMTSQRKQIDQIIQRLQKDSSLQKTPSENGDFKDQNEKLQQKINNLQNQIEKLKNQDLRKFQIDFTRRQQPMPNTASQQAIASKNLQIQKQLKKIGDLQFQQTELKNKYNLLENDLDRAKREQARWKERYRIMQGQKDQRIKLLEETLKTLSK